MENPYRKENIVKFEVCSYCGSLGKEQIGRSFQSGDACKECENYFPYLFELWDYYGIG